MSSHAIPHPDRRRAERRQSGTPHSHTTQHMQSGYGRFAAMVAAASVTGFMAMYLNSYEAGHVYFSWTRVFMAMIMGGTMTVIMMLFMWRMYPNRTVNRLVLAFGALLAAAGLILVRSQATVGDVAWMRAMIPHHSIAILTSERAHISDPRVRKLADGIIESQKREIAEMKSLVAEMGRSP